MHAQAHRGSRDGLWDPLTPAEANILLHDGGYGLRLLRDAAGCLRLAGAGAGTGLPLGTRPTWADLYQALVRLRRTRAEYDPAWLHRLSRLLAREPVVSEPEWVVLPPGRVERLEVAPQRSGRCLRGLSTSHGSMLFPAGVPQPQWITVEPGVQLRAGGLDRDVAHRQLDGWARLARAVDSDPVLRMHCATLPAPAALVDRRGGTAAWTRIAEPAPAHPNHPGGTVVVGLADLLRPRLLRQVIDNRFERYEDELEYFLEHFIRPPLRGFRLALEGHGLGLGELGPPAMGFELSPELQATGRIVVTDYAQVGEADADSLRAGARMLADTLTALDLVFSGLRQDPARVRAGIERVTSQELRHLTTEAADLLGKAGSLRHFVHTVAPSQDRVLTEVLRAVQECTRQRRRDRTLPRATVVIDLDLCALLPWQRTVEATRSVAGARPGAPGGIPELADAPSLSPLPSYVQAAWENFVELSGLGAKYPAVDWRQVHTEFCQAFFRPWERLRTDVVNAGLARFVWDVRDAGGRVVFCTGRRERVRGYTEEVLAAAGVAGSTLLCMPDDHSRAISELKVQRLRGLGELDVVAVFDDVLANRIALSKEFPAARVVAVEPAGLASERHPSQVTPDAAAVIGSFETSPRPAASARLSHAHSLEELQIGELRRNRLAQRWALRLGEEESLAVVDSILTDVDSAAERTASRARAKFGLDRADAGHESTLRALHHVFTRKQFLKGSRSHYRYPDMLADAAGFVRSGRPIDVVLLGFPVKQCLNRLKAYGPLPDLAELGALARLRELRQAVREVYPPGLRLNLLTDGQHYRRRPSAITGAYHRRLWRYAELVGIADCLVLAEVDEVAERRLGREHPARYAQRRYRYCRQLAEALRGFDITDGPLRTLDAVESYASTVNDWLGDQLRLFREMVMSLVYSVPVRTPARVDRMAWSRQVFADVYNLTDPNAGTNLVRARAGVLRRAWQAAVRYLATMRADEEMGYENLFPHRVRLTVSGARPGRCGFSYLGGSGLLPWQGTGAIDRRGQLAVDFAVALLDQGFVPVYSALLGPRQPWLMAPAGDSVLAAGVRLRRK